jgi:hypothetical protein
MRRDDRSEARLSMGWPSDALRCARALRRRAREALSGDVRDSVSAHGRGAPTVAAKHRQPPGRAAEPSSSRGSKGVSFWGHQWRGGVGTNLGGRGGGWSPLPSPSRTIRLDSASSNRNSRRFLDSASSNRNSPRFTATEHYQLMSRTSDDGTCARRRVAARPRGAVPSPAVRCRTCPTSGVGRRCAGGNSPRVSGQHSGIRRCLC